jgi:uncharacterized protein
LKIDIRGEKFILCPEKCLIREKDNSMYLADLHIGKSNHFRKNGIGVPNKLIEAELQSLENILIKYKPQSVYFLGDLFHSSHNLSVPLFQEFLFGHSSISFILVEGNHDILDANTYASLLLTKHNTIEEKDFIFSHEPLDDATKFNFCGHIHPGITMSAKGKQNMKLPCFYITDQRCILPAFGVFTGLANIVPQKGDKFYIPHGNEVIKVV